MHHKYVIRDAETVWTGSTNWTADSWTRGERHPHRRVARLAARFAEDFSQLWTRRDVEKTGRVDTPRSTSGARASAPGSAPAAAKSSPTASRRRSARPRRRIRIASPVISSGPILGTLAQVAGDGKVDLAGVVDRTQVHEVIRQWRANGNAPWKEPLLRAALSQAPFSGKHSTPYAPGRVHDYMHAKVTVADDVVFLGSFNLSHSGEQNAENVLEIADPALAERLAGFIDGIRAKYPEIDV